MTDKDDLTRLKALAGLVLDHRLAQMREVSSRLERSRAQIAAIDAAAAPSDLPEVLGAVVSGEYRRWADARKAALNEVLARQRAESLQARAEAETAFGRLQALKGLAARLDRRG